jgi:hypothetical protein
MEIINISAGNPPKHSHPHYVTLKCLPIEPGTHECDKCLFNGHRKSYYTCSDFEANSCPPPDGYYVVSAKFLKDFEEN